MKLLWLSVLVLAFASLAADERRATVAPSSAPNVAGAGRNANLGNTPSLGTSTGTREQGRVGPATSGTVDDQQNGRIKAKKPAAEKEWEGADTLKNMDR